MDPAQSAIDAALRGNWKAAENLNKRILTSDSCDKEALCRLARAYLELGKLPKSIATYKKVLKLDPYNSIAQKALTRLVLVENNTVNPPSIRPIPSPTLFIEEPGKTKTVSLIHLGDIATISQLDAGEPVKLIPHAHRVSVETEGGKYIGRLPDDLSRRVIFLTRGGNLYSSHIRSISPEAVRIFIREIYKSEKLKDILSFPLGETRYIPDANNTPLF